MIERCIVVSVLLMGCLAGMYGIGPQINSEYYVHDGKNIIYLEMETSEVKELLGEPDGIEIFESEDPLHDFDLICWKYEDLYVSFYDIEGTGIITKIDLLEGERRFQLGDVRISETGREEIMEIYGEPDYKFDGNDGFLVYEYDIPPFRRFPYTFILEFRFNKEDVCDQIVFIRDDFFK